MQRAVTPALVPMDPRIDSHVPRHAGTRHTAANAGERLREVIAKTEVRDLGVRRAERWFHDGSVVTSRSHKRADLAVFDVDVVNCLGFFGASSEKVMLSSNPVMLSRNDGDGDDDNDGSNMTDLGALHSFDRITPLRSAYSFVVRHGPLALVALLQDPRKRILVVPQYC